MQLDKLKEECDRLRSLGGDTSELEQFIQANDGQPQMQVDRAWLTKALKQAQPPEVIDAEIVRDTPIPIQQKAGELARLERQSLALAQPPIDLKLKALGQECIDLLPPEQKTRDRVAKIADLIRQGDETRLTSLYNALHQNYQITVDNSSHYAPVHAPQTHLDYRDDRQYYEDYRQETTIVYAPNIYEITYAPSNYETTEVYAPRYENPYPQPCGCSSQNATAIVNVHGVGSYSHTETREGGWNGLLWALTALLFTILAFGISGGISRVNQFNGGGGFPQGGTQ